MPRMIIAAFGALLALSIGCTSDRAEIEQLRRDVDALMAAAAAPTATRPPSTPPATDSGTPGPMPSAAAATATASSSGESGSGEVVARASTTVNGTTYETLCTRLDDRAPTSSSVSVAQSTTSENGVLSVSVVLRTNDTEYAVVVAGVKDASALAALNAVLVNVVCEVSP